MTAAAAAAGAAALGGDDAEQEPVELSEAYVHSLASLGLERLQNEPGRLHAEAVAVDEALHALSLDHYRVFIQNQECVRHVRTQGKEMEGHLSSLLTEVHGLGAEFSVFQREAAELVGGHKRNRQTLKHHMQLVELLEVPQLMDACVRSDLMEEALSIATFASTLERRHRSRRAASLAPPGDGGGGGDKAGSFSTAGDGAARGDVPGVIKMIVEEVRASARDLHDRLVAKLRGPIQLTSCLQVVSCLRRLELLALEEKNEKKQQQQRRRGLAEQADASSRKGSQIKKGGASLAKSEAAGHGSGRGGASGGGISRRQLALVEMKLQVDFLEARDAWLADSASRAGLAGAAGDLQRHSLGAASGSAASSPYQALMDLIESSRSQWFEVATQFRAIFLSVDGGGGGVGGGSSQLSSARGANSGGSGRESGDVLSLWLLRRVSAFVEQLKGVLPLIEDGGLLRSLLEECMFFGASMGRLGTDFRGLLVPVFEDRVSGAAAAQWATASAEFVTTLRDIAAIEVAGGNGSSLLYVPDKTAATAAAAAAASVVAGDGDNKKAALPSVGGGDGGVPSPPRSLMAFPPVARLLNLVLTSFNQLRECLPSSLEDRLADSLVLCFTEVFRGLADLTKTTLRANAASDAATPAGAGGPSSGRGSRASPRSSSGAGGGGGGGGGGAVGFGEHLNTTSRAVDLACCALAEQVVPHLATCFAALFGEYPATAAAAAATASSMVSGRVLGGKAEGRAEKLRARLLGALETFDIYEPPRPPAPAAAPSPPAAAAAGTKVTASGAPISASTASAAGMPAAPAATESPTPAADAPFSPVPAAAEGATTAAEPTVAAAAADAGPGAESAEGQEETLGAGGGVLETPEALDAGDGDDEDAAAATVSD